MKEKISILAGNALAAFMDFGIGTAVATLVAYSYGVSLPWYLVFLSGVLALVPDFDLVPSVVFGVSPTFDHKQTPLHRPLLVLPLVITGAYLFGGEMWLVIAAICVSGHYLHDTNFIGTNYGIAWFWPFSHKFWSAFGSFTPEPYDENGSHNEWLRENWLRPSFLSVREISIGLVGLSITLWMLSHSPLVVGTAWLLFALSFGSLWTVQRST
jgi:hypothetical protein